MTLAQRRVLAPLLSKVGVIKQSLRAITIAPDKMNVSVILTLSQWAQILKEFGAA